MWHVSFRSGVATLRTAIHLLLTQITRNIVALCGCDAALQQMVHCKLRPRHPCTMDSSSLGARRRLGHDETYTTQQGR